MANEFGEVSNERLYTCHPLIICLEKKAIGPAPFDYGIGCGFRGEEAQNKAYLEKKSRAVWGESSHNIIIGGQPCSFAVDHYIWEKGKAIWGDEGPEERWKMIVLMRYLQGAAIGQSIPVKLGLDFKGSWDLPHLQLHKEVSHGQI